MRNVYLSPHFDDIAFSLGTQALNAAGLLVNIFSRSGYVAGTPMGSRPSADTVERVSALRDAEDAQFAQLAGLDRVALGADEPSLSGRSPFGIADIDLDIAAIEAPLLAMLDRIASDETTPFRLFAPAGIGRHVNHLAVRAIAIAWYRANPDSAALAFYEDLPYAANWRKRTQGIVDLLRVTHGLRLGRKSWPASPRKLAAINLYASQHLQPVATLTGFSPAAIWPRGAHEAVWNVAGPRRRSDARGASD